MSLQTTYLGLKLNSPLMPGASPLTQDLDVVKRLEDAGASAIVLHSLFEEQVRGERYASLYQMELHAESFAEATSYFPRHDEFKLGPEEYLKHIEKIKAVVKIPVIASLNGMSKSGWLHYAKDIVKSGADALELNVYHVATDSQETASEVEERILEVTRALRKEITIPLAIKLSPFFASIPNLSVRLFEAGADGLVLFNRFYQPDIDLDNLEVTPSLRLSDPSELLLRLRWLAIVSGQTRATLACSGGVHSATDAVKAIMCGAHAVQLVSCLLLRGPGYIKHIMDGLKEWMEKHEYTSIRQLRGCMSLSHCPDPAAFERANYMRVLGGWKPTGEVEFA